MVDATNVFVTFNLVGADLGLYDVVASKPDGQTAVKADGFTVVEGGEPSLAINIVAPGSTRPNSIIIMQVEFANTGNIDILDAEIDVNSIEGAPIGFSLTELEDLLTDIILELKEPGGPLDKLRPGAQGSISVYTKATTGIGYILQLPELDK